MQPLSFRRVCLGALVTTAFAHDSSRPAAPDAFSNWEPLSHDKYAQGSFAACDSMCDFAGISASCSSRIEYSAQHNFWGQRDKCERAHHLVAKQCSDTCADCSVKASGCHEKFYWKPEWGSTTTEGPTTTGSKGCLTTCEIDGEHLTCREHVQRVANHTFSLAPISCTLAYGWVLERCEHCSACPTVRTGCTTSPPPPTTTVTSSTSTTTSATTTETSTATSSTSTITVSSTTLTSSTSTETTTTTTHTSTLTSTTTITSTTTTTQKQWYKFLTGQSEEDVKVPASSHAPAGHAEWVVGGLSLFTALAVVARWQSSRRIRADRESGPFANVRNINDPELAEALAGLE